MPKVSKKSKTFDDTEVLGYNPPAALEYVAPVLEEVVESRPNPGPGGDPDSSSSDSDDERASGGDIPPAVHNLEIPVCVRDSPPALFRPKDPDHLFSKGESTTRLQALPSIEIVRGWNGATTFGPSC